MQNTLAQEIPAPASQAQSSAWPDSLLCLLEHQQTLVNHLLQLAETQADLISSGRTEDVLNVLAKRQGLIDEFNASQAPMTDLTRRLDERISQASAGQRQRIESIIADIGQKLAQVMQRDEQDQARLREARDHTHQELSALGAGKQARQAYVQSQTGAHPRPSSQPNNRYADQRG